jgi:hypothetical protein
MNSQNLRKNYTRSFKVSTNRNIKIDEVLVAYNRFKTEKDNTVKVQIIDKKIRQILLQLNVKKEVFSKSTFEELQALIRFKARKEGFILPKNWSFLGNTI